ncbi:uncharacterized protein LOC110813134 [Carica papaya]|uniref:uncharacterized protein LOC110813134 n=1 Tax=Carica papaya TaxID=3649 RepID=UPI000B8CA351|nr:uncharacterized protein LOC110813134 [Carica papaya]
MALRLTKLTMSAGEMVSPFALRRWTHVSAMRTPLDCLVDYSVASPPTVLPEFDHDHSGSTNQKIIGFGFPISSFGGSMELMAVPKKKVSPHKRGIRNGPKALKPTPVIIRCKSCGRVKLPHFYCCSGDRGNAVWRELQKENMEFFRAYFHATSPRPFISRHAQRAPRFATKKQYWK